MELLGTTSNAPGPTAAQAQVVYEAQQREAALAALKKKRRVRHRKIRVLRFCFCLKSIHRLV